MKKNLTVIVVSIILMNIANCNAQTASISGFVCDEKGQAYLGANVLLGNGKTGCISDNLGKFAFENVQQTYTTLTISAIGYQTITIAVKTDTLKFPLQISLIPYIEKLEEIKIHANKKERLKKEESISIQLVEEEFLKEARAGSLMQTLQSIPGLNAINIGTGISKPMIRGLGFYRVVVAQNGIKTEGQQWSNHHGVSIDQQSAGHVEVIKGPASLQYGSDAIGGVINVLPPHVPLQGGLDGNISLVAKSNTQWLGASTNISFRKADLYTNITLNHNSFGDYMVNQTDSFLSPSSIVTNEYASHKIYMGNQVYNTSGRENAATANLGIIKSWGNSYFELAWMDNKYGFFDWAGLRNENTFDMHKENPSDVQLPYQDVQNISIYHFTNYFIGENKLEVSLGYQNNRSEEMSFATHHVYIGLLLQTITGKSMYSFNLSENHRIKTGIDIQIQQHNKNGISHILPNYSKNTAGFFITDKYNISRNWILNSGLRFNWSNLNIKESINPSINPGILDSIFNPNFRTTYPGNALLLGINYLPSKDIVLKANVGKSFRTPSVYELGAYGLHRHEGRFEKGDINNQPETAWQFDLGYEHNWQAFHFTISPFLIYFTNYLYLKPTPDFAPGLGQIYIYEQSKALLTGGETSCGFSTSHGLSLSLNAEYAYAVNLDLMSSLPFTPPLNIQTNINYTINKKGAFKKSKIGMDIINVAAQKFTVPNELSTPGYTSVNIYGSSEILWGNQTINIMLKVQNLLNNKYFNHISFYRRIRIPEPSRDFQLSLTLPFKNK